MFALGLGIAYGASVEISSSVPGGVTINIVPIQASADVNGDGIVDRRDLAAVTRKLGTHPAGRAREDINHDGTIDIIDLTIIAQYFGQRVQT